MNCHISEIRTGKTTDKFDKHVFLCKQEKNIFKEPLFQVFAFIKLKDERLLLSYESHFYALGFDTMN